MKNRVFRLVKKNHKPSLEGGFFPKERGIPTTDVIYIPPAEGEAYGTTQKIRYARGEKEIEEEYQSHNAKKGEITFMRGFFFLNPRNVTLSKYIDTCNYNVSNPNRDPKAEAIFFEIKPGEESKKYFGNKTRSAEAVLMIANMDAEEARELCDVFGIPTAGVDPGDLRYHLNMRAEQNVESFMRTISSVETQEKRVISRAFRRGVLYTEGQVVKMHPSGRTIGVMKTSHHIAELYDYFHTNEGRDLFILINNMIEGNNSASNEKEILDETMSPENTGVTAPFANMTIPEAFTEHNKLDEDVQVIKRNEPYYEYKGERIGKSKKEVYAFLENNPDVLKKIKSLLLIYREETV